MDAETAVGPVAPVADLVVAERDVRNDQIESRVGQRGGFEPLDSDVNAERAIQHLENAPGHVVQLDRGDAASRGDVLRHAADEVADTAAGIEDAAAIEPQMAQDCPDPVDDERLGVVAVVDRGFG